MEADLNALRLKLTEAPFDEQGSLDLIEKLAFDNEQGGGDFNRLVWRAGKGWGYLRSSQPHPSLAHNIMDQLIEAHKVKGTASERPGVITEAQAVVLLQCLFKHGMTIEEPESRAQTQPIAKLAITYDLEEVFKTCLMQYENKDFNGDSVSRSLLGWAISSRKPDRIRELLDMGFPFNYLDIYGITPLSFATATVSDSAVIRALTEHPRMRACSKLDLQSLYLKKESLAHAMRAGNRAMVDFLLQIGADINEPYEGRPLIHRIISSQNMDLLEHFINHGADVNAVNLDGNTACHIAAMTPFREAIPALVAAGANWQLKNNDQKTPFQEARRFKSREAAAHELRQLSLIEKERIALSKVTQKEMKAKEKAVQRKPKASEGQPLVNDGEALMAYQKRKNRI